MSLFRSIIADKVTFRNLGGVAVGAGVIIALIQNDFVVLYLGLMLILIGFLLILSSVQDAADPVRIRIVNRTGRQLRITYDGPGEIGKKSGTIEGVMPFPPGKVSSLPRDVVSLEVSNRGSKVGSLNSETEERWAGHWLDDA